MHLPGCRTPRSPILKTASYDQNGVYASVADRHLQPIAEHGRMAWQTASGYTKRARAEAAIGRWKQVIGDRLRAPTDERRAAEVDVAVHVLNRMLELIRSPAD